MRSVTELNGLGDIRTAISTRARSASRQKGATYVDIMSLGMEKLRLEAELAWFVKRQRRIEARLEETQGSLERLLSAAKQRGEAGAPLRPSNGAGTTPVPEARVSTPPKWRNMTIEY